LTSRPGEGAGSGAADSGAQAPPLDDVDRAIVAMLREDGRISIRALAARLHISRAGAYLRMQRLEDAGVITGCSAWVDPQRYGYGLSAYVHLKITAPCD
jgi:DNA-binding Lrp family transcriptional regulator